MAATTAVWDAVSAPRMDDEPSDDEGGGVNPVQLRPSLASRNRRNRVFWCGIASVVGCHPLFQYIAAALWMSHASNK